MTSRPQSSRAPMRREGARMNRTVRVTSAPKGGSSDTTWNSSLTLSGSQVSLTNRTSPQRQDAWTTAGSMYFEDLRNMNQNKMVHSDDQGLQRTSYNMVTATPNSSYSSICNGDNFDTHPARKFYPSTSSLNQSFVSRSSNVYSSASATFGSSDSLGFQPNSSCNMQESSDSCLSTSMDNNLSRSLTPGSSLSLQNHASDSSASRTVSVPRKKGRKRNKGKVTVKQESFHSDSATNGSEASFGQLIQRQAFNASESLGNRSFGDAPREACTPYSVSSEYSYMVYNVQVPHPADISGNIRPPSPLKNSKPITQETNTLLTSLKDVLSKYPVIRISENEDSGLGSNAESSRQSPQVSRDRTPVPTEDQLQVFRELLASSERPSSQLSSSGQLLTAADRASPRPSSRVSNHDDREGSNKLTSALGNCFEYCSAISKASSRPSSRATSLENIEETQLAIPAINSEAIKRTVTFAPAVLAHGGSSSVRIGLEQRAAASIATVQAATVSQVHNEDGGSAVASQIPGPSPVNGAREVVACSEVYTDPSTVLTDNLSDDHDGRSQVTLNDDYSSKRTLIDSFLNDTLSNASSELEKLRSLPVYEPEPEATNKRNPKLNETFSKGSFEIVQPRHEMEKTKESSSGSGGAENDPRLAVGSSSQEEKSKLKEIFSFLDDVDKENRTALRGLNESSLDSDAKSKYSRRVLSSMTPEELGDEILALQVLLQEKDRKLSSLERELNQEQELSRRATKNAEKELRSRLSTQRTEFEKTIERLQKLADELQQERKELQAKLAKSNRDSENLKQKFDDTRRQIEERHSAEIKRIRSSFAVAQRQQQSKWLSEKSNQIKEMTVRGLEPELHRLMEQHKQELETLRSLHRAELQRLQESAQANHVNQIESLRSQFQVEKEGACTKEREASKLRFDRELDDLERSFRDRQSRLESELCRERARFTNEQSRLEQEAEETIKKLHDKFEREKNLMIEEFRSELKIMESKTQIHFKSTCESLNRNKEEAVMRVRKTFEEKLENINVALSNAEAKIRVKDREAQAIQDRLTEELQKMKAQMEGDNQRNLKVLKEKLNLEVAELEAKVDEQKLKISELRMEVSAKEESLVSVRVSLSLRTKELEESQVVLGKYSSERNDLRKVLRSEMELELLALEEERNKLRGEVSRVKGESCESKMQKEAEVNQLKLQHQNDLKELHNRVRQAVSVKDETISQLQQKLHASAARCQSLEDMIDKLQQQKMGETKK